MTSPPVLVTLLLGVVVALGGPGPAPRHDLHVSYGDLAVERNVAVLRVRIFRDDLGEVLARHARNPTLRLEPGPLIDRRFLAYLGEHFSLEVDGVSLPARILESGEDSLDREPVWWYTVRFDAPEPIRAGRLRNTLLFELFTDQRNVVKVVHFPDETSRTFYFAPGEEEADLTFGEARRP